MCGADPVAVDAIGSTIMGFNPEDLEYLQLAALKKFGEIDVRKIAVVGEPLAEVTRHFVMGTGRSGMSYVGQGQRDWQVAAGDGDWQAVASESRYVDAAYELGPDDLDEVWAYTEFECDSTVEAELWLGADGPTTVYIAGEVVAALNPSDGHRLGEAKAKVELPAGRVAVLVRTHQSTAGCGFTLLACGAPGRLPLGVHYVKPTADSAMRARERVASATN
jgi:hypothetical protein